jgi:prophage regulatory protein
MFPYSLCQNILAQFQGAKTISRSSIYAMVLEGSFPKPLKIGRRSVGWRPEDIESWLLQKQETAEDKRA